MRARAGRRRDPARPARWGRPWPSTRRSSRRWRCRSGSAARSCSRPRACSAPGAFKIRGAMNKLASLGEARRQRRDGRAAPATTPRRWRSPPGTSACRATSSCPTGAPITQDRGVPGLRRDRRRGRRVARRGGRRRPGARPTTAAWRSATRSTTRPSSPGRARSGSSWSRTSPTWRCVVVPLGGGGLAAGTAIAVKSLRPDVRVIGVQAAACAPVRRRAAADRSGRHAGRRHRRQAPGHAHRAARRAVGRRRSSPSTRTPSPTPWCC